MSNDRLSLLDDRLEDSGAETVPDLQITPPPVGRRLLRPRTILSFLVAFAILFFFVRSLKLDFAEIWARMRTANGPLLALAFAVYYVSFLTRSLRWQLLLANVGYSRDGGHPMPSTAGLLEIVYLSWFANCIVPARLGDAYRSYMLKKAAGVSFTITLGTILAERLLDIIVLALMMGGAALFAFHGALPTEASQALVGGLILAGVGIAGLVALPRLRPLVQRLLPHRLYRHYEGVQSGVTGSFQRVPLLIGYTVTNWLIEGTTLYMIAWAVGAPVSVVAAIVVALVASLLSTVPFTPAGLGVAEAGIVLILTQVGIDKNAAGAIGLLDRVITYWSIVFGGAIVYALSRKK